MGLVRRLVCGADSSSAIVGNGTKGLLLRL